MNRSDSGMGKFDLGLWVSVILLVIAVVLTILIVRGKFPVPWRNPILNGKSLDRAGDLAWSPGLEELLGIYRSGVPKAVSVKESPVIRATTG
jgi:hypothetical protein